MTRWWWYEAHDFRKESYLDLESSLWSLPLFCVLFQTDSLGSFDTISQAFFALKIHCLPRAAFAKYCLFNRRLVGSFAGFARLQGPETKEIIPERKKDLFICQTICCCQKTWLVDWQNRFILTKKYALSAENLKLLAFRLHHKASWWLSLFSALIDYVVAMQLQSHGSVLPNPLLDSLSRIFDKKKNTTFEIVPALWLCWGT